MVLRCVLLFAALVTSATAGCGGTDPAPGDRRPHDVPGPDGGAPAGRGDASTSDAGASDDADGTPVQDAGDEGDGQGLDAAVPRRDAGEPVADAGEPVSDHDDGGVSSGGHAPPTDAALDYFSDLDQSLRDQALVDALHEKLAADHEALSYDELPRAYATVDSGRDGCAGIFDFYSSKCWSSSQKCGSYVDEGDCFNREHSWPKSWWGGSEGPDQHHDLIMVLPSDGYVNYVRGNLPFGEVTDPDYTSTNGSRRGRCAVPGAPANRACFEPADALKGDFARIYFYFAARYEGELACCSEDAVAQSDINSWQEDMLRRWHERDPVDIPERTRNERVFTLQKTRNPFVDLPQLVEQVSDF